MESLSKILMPYKDIVGNAAMVVTIAQFFSGSFICRDIIRKKSTKNTPSVPFVGGLVIGILMMKYGLLLGDSKMLIVNIFAIVLNLIYLMIFHAYSTNKWDELFKFCSYGSALVAVFLGYAEWEDPKNVEQRYGLIITILLLILIGSPLVHVNDIIKNKDASGIPVPMTLIGTAMSLLWFLYGVILMNEFMIVQNVIAFALCVFQIVLIVKYPGNTKQTKKSTSKVAKKKNAKRE